MLAGELGVMAGDDARAQVMVAGYEASKSLALPSSHASPGLTIPSPHVGCDDGNQVNDDGCTNACALPSECRRRIRQAREWQALATAHNQLAAAGAADNGWTTREKGRCGEGGVRFAGEDAGSPGECPELAPAITDPPAAGTSP